MADISKLIRKGDVYTFSGGTGIIVSDSSFNQKNNKSYIMFIQRASDDMVSKITAAKEGFYLSMTNKLSEKFIINDSICSLIMNDLLTHRKGRFIDSDVIHYIESRFWQLMDGIFSKQEINIILNGYSITKCDNVIPLPNIKAKTEPVEEKPAVVTKPTIERKLPHNYKLSKYIKGLTKRQARAFEEFHNNNDMITIINKYSLSNYDQLRKIINKCTELLGKNNCNFVCRRKNSTNEYKKWKYHEMNDYLDYLNSHTESETYIHFFKNNESFSIVRSCKIYCEKFLINNGKEPAIPETIDDVLLESDNKSETLINALQKSDFVSTAIKTVYGGGVHVNDNWIF